jgi:LuxR family maltose regulon positive regulatory protein
MIPTKVRVPAPRTDYIVRPRLHSQCNSFENYALNIVIAPAGYGKSCLVSNWANRNTRTVAWLSLNKEDATTSRFWSYVLYALKEASESQLAIDLENDRFVDISDCVNSLDRLILSIAEWENDMFLVLEDYHYLNDSSDIDNALSYLLENCPENLHVILISRKSPNLRTMKKRLATQLNEISEESLRFTFDETSAFFIHENIPVTSRFVEQAMEVVNGWPAGLRLLALLLGDVASDNYVDKLPSGFSEAVNDFMFEEVIDALPPQIQKFALLTSFLDSYCPTLAAWVLDALGVRDVEETTNASIQYLRGNSVFITEIADSESEPWFNYHSLLGQALRTFALRKGKRYGHEVCAAASKWFRQENAFDSAVMYAARAQNYDAIAQIIHQIWPQVLANDELAMLLRWYGYLPEDYVSQHPRLCLLQALPLAVSGNFDLARRRLSQAQEASKNTSDHYAATALAIQSLISSIDGKPALAKESAAKALDILPSGESHFRAMAHQVLGSSALDENIIKARQVFEQAIEMGISLNDKNVLCSAYSNFSFLEALIGCSDCAERHSRLAKEIHADYQARTIPMLNVAYLADGVVAYHQYRLKEAAAACRYVIEHSGYSYIRRNYATAQTLLACVSLCSGKTAEARELALSASELYFDGFADAFPGMSLLKICHAIPGFVKRAMSQQEDGEDQRLSIARLWMNRVFAFFEKENYETDELEQDLVDIDEGYIIAKININLLIACSYERAGTNDKAQQFLSDAFDIAKPHQITQPFIDARIYCPQTLRQLAKSTPDGFGASVYKTLPTVFADDSPSAPPETPIISAREIDVMRLVELGFSTNQIAERLFISSETVKKHIKHVFVKIEAHSRLQAINTLKKHGLL